MLKKLTIGDVNNSSYNKDVEHLVLELGAGTDYPDGALIFFIRQFDDLLISSPEGNLLMDWDVNHEVTDFDEAHCMILQPHDNLKELGNIKSTLIAFKAQDDTKKIKVYITIQRN